jgi:hypothetical protein
MGGQGPVPKETRQRDRDTPTRELVKADGKLGGFPLPEDVLPFIPLNQEYEGFDERFDDRTREVWHPQTVRWWQSWRESPQATRMLTAVDWDYLLDTALLHHQMWESGGKNSERAAEIRLRVATFGATPADRLRLKLEIETPAEFDAGNVHGGDAVITSIQDRRKRLTGG